MSEERSAVTALRASVRDFSYGFLLVPGLVATALIVVALVMLAVDTAVGPGIAFGGNAEAARQVLAVIATSLITVAGVAFSITIVTLQLVSSQFSPRALREFLSDRLNQIIAGTFVGTFGYCLVALGSVGSDPGSGDPFVPALTVSLGVVLGIANIAVLLIFIHHLSQSIQVSNITRAIAHGGLQAVDHLYPERHGVEPTEEPASQPLDERTGGRVVRAQRPGYIQHIAVADIAAEWGRTAGEQRRQATGRGPAPIVFLRVAPGDFVTGETVLVECWPPHEGGRIDEVVHRSVRVADSRDVRQDAPYAIRQLVDIALRAISPSVNDPTTAITCIGYVRAIMERLASRPFPGEVRLVGDPEVLVKARRRSFNDIASEAFAEIGRYGRGDPRVIGELLMAIEAAMVSAVGAEADDRVPSLLRLAHEAAEPAIAETSVSGDRQYLRERIADVVEAGSPRRPGPHTGTSSRSTVSDRGR